MICLGYGMLAAQTSMVGLHTHTVYRMDGSVLKGEIVEWTNDSITFRLLNGVTVHLDQENVRKVVSRKMSRPDRKVRGGDGGMYPLKEEGMYNVTTIGMSGRRGAGIGLTHAVGHQFSRLFGVGGGIGIETFDIELGMEMVPVFVEVRGYLTERSVSPYYAVRTGYGFAIKPDDQWVQDADGGMLFQAELGYRFSASRAVNFFAGIGIHLQRAEYRYLFPWEFETHDRLTFRRTELKIGVMF
jgi:hypothetical protein